MRKIIFLLLPIFLLITCVSSYGTNGYESLIAKGIENLNKGKYEDALKLLLEALKIAPDNKEAAFYAAVAYSRLGRFSDAEELFKRIIEEQEYASNVYLELGKIYYTKGYCISAKRYLKRFLSLATDPRAINYARGIIEKCREMEERRPYRLNITAGLQYDDNVVLEPTNPPLPAEQKDDTRVVALVSAGARVWKSDFMNARVDYNFYQSFHFRLEEYNVHYHKIRPSIKLTVSDFFTPSVGYAFEYIHFDREIYGLIHTYFINLNLKRSEITSTDIIYERRDNDYRNTATFTTNEERKGPQNTFGLRQNIVFERARAEIHYFYDDKHAQAHYWEYRGHRIGGSLNYKLKEPINIILGVDYFRRRHKADFPGTSDTRIDNTQQYKLNIRYLINTRMAVSITENYTRNDSSLVDFDYKRNMIGVFLTYSLI